MMAALRIAIPTDLKRKLDQKMAGGESGDMSTYVSDLIRRDLDRRHNNELEEALLRGLKSGRPRKMTPKDWADIRREVARRTAARRSRAS